MQEENSQNFTRRIERLKFTRGLSDEALAEHVDISRRMLWLIRKGKAHISAKSWWKLEAAERAAGIVSPLPTTEEAVERVKNATPADTDFYLTENYRYRLNRMLDEMAEAGGKIVDTAKGMKALLAEMQAHRAAAAAKPARRGKKGGGG